MDVEQLFNLTEGSVVDFEDSFFITGFPLPNFNILEKGPYVVKQTFKHKWSTEYTIEGSEHTVFMEVERDEDDHDDITILLQIGIDKLFRRVRIEFLETWNDPQLMKFDFNGVTYYLEENAFDESDGEEYEYWDFYSEEIDGGDQCLFIGVEDYSEDADDRPEWEVFMGFTLPTHAVKSINVK